MVDRVHMEAAALTAVMQRDIEKALNGIVTLATVDAVGVGEVTILDGGGSRTIPKAMGATMRPNDTVVVLRRGHAEIALAAVTVQGVAEPVIEGDWASITTALEEKVDKDDYAVDQTLHALTHTNLQTAIDAKVAQGDYDTAMVANAVAHTALQDAIDDKLPSAALVRKRLATDVTTTGTTFVGVSGLSLPVAAGETWLATFILVCGANQDGQFNLVVPSGTTVRGFVQYDTTVLEGSLVTGAGGYPLLGGAFSGAAARVEVSLLVTTTGTVQPQIKATSGQTGAITAGSFLTAHRV